MSDWSTTAWVLTGRFWAALPRLGPDSIACERQRFKYTSTNARAGESVLRPGVRR